MNRTGMLLIVSAACLASLLFCGCASQNNYRECRDFFDYLVRNQVAVSKIQPLRPDPFRASDGMAFEVDGFDGEKDAKMDIAIYKFNLDMKLMQDRMSEIRKSGGVFLVGIKLPTKVNGSFILIGYERCKQKKQILKAFEEFK